LLRVGFDTGGNITRPTQPAEVIMSEKMSRIIFIGELIVIVLPLLILLSIGTIFQIYTTFAYFMSHQLVLSVIAVVSCVALLCGVVISINFLQQGSAGLRQARTHLWWLSFIGMLIALSSWVSMQLPPSQPYSTMAMFRDGFKLFTLGLPVAVPLAHLLLERYLRKETQTS
jgi:hypothetical protein